MIYSEVSCLILVNNQAGSGRIEDEWPIRKKQLLEALGPGQVDIAFTTSQDHGAQRVRQALSQGVKKILVVGGDGTFSEVIQGFFEGNRNVAPETVLILMPGGRGDDFFKTITGQRFYRKKSSWTKGLDIIRYGTPVSVDVGKITLGSSPNETQRYFINVSSFGFPGLVLDRGKNEEKSFINKLIKKTSFAYFFQSVTALGSYNPLIAHVIVDGTPFFKGELHSGFILNGRFNAGGICWDDNSKINDGLLGVMLMEYRNFFSFSINSLRILMGSAQERVGVHRGEGKKIEVIFEGDSKPHSLFEVDGDLFEKNQDRRAVFEVLQKAIKIQAVNNF